MPNKTTDPIDTPEQILFNFQNDSFKPFNLFSDRKITKESCIEQMVNARTEALAALNSYYHSQTEKVLGEVIGGDQHDVKDAGGNLYMSSNIRSNNAMRAEQRQRAAERGFNLKEEAE